ncbi:hypothetical protein [Frigoribacterium sp. SL97]|uniref:hypothetical protein n=1 Tax=Frigoribacterium sp. SL97 TaxID=2994664 RepID=UPI00226E3DE2|nr:hypothetical protein [Frigoribacterium sp. SL97]WAC50285.1 hypothetical protein OVA02_10320 [Frigoribacterium sp. SL97]
MTTTFLETEHPRAATGVFVEKSQSAPELAGLAAAPATRSEQARAALRTYTDNTRRPFEDLPASSDRGFAGKPDAARVAALATAEGMQGIVSEDGNDGVEDHHLVVLARVDDDGISHTVEVPFRTPAGQAPDATTVLDALLSDSAGLNDVDDVEEWADQYGYDMEGEAAQVTASYEAVLEQDAKLRAFLGEKHDEYLWGDQ